MSPDGRKEVPSMKYPEFEPLFSSPCQLILDTDIGPDCDDVGAIAVLYHMQKKYGFEVAAIINCTSNRYGCGVLDVLRRYCGAPEHAIGLYTKAPFLEDCVKYNKEVSEKFSPALMDGTLPITDSTELYGKILSEAADKSVVICTIGQFNALADAMKTYPELFQTKVRSMVSMAGQYPEGKREYNVYCDAQSAAYVFDHVTFPVVFSGFEVGIAFRTGFTPESNLPDNPLWLSYHLYTNGQNANASFDLTAVQFAAEGCGDFYDLTDPVDVVVDPTDGSETITPNPDAPFRFMKIREGRTEALASYLSAMVREF
ncbi:MAG: hypothetical protein E7428_11100 [Ruminococcaceae bacterium]|nr:hypothetical protein [Oscillospiraceae bacterium]